MKCPHCGLVTFDDQPQCPRCEQSFELVRPMASSPFGETSHILRDEPDLRSELRDRLHRARLERRKANENPMAAETGPDAPDWFEPASSEEDGFFEAAAIAEATDRERSEERGIVTIDDLPPDEQARGGATTADFDNDELDFSGVAGDESAEPEFSGPIPGFSDWREELRERLKRIRARREQERIEREATGEEEADPAAAMEPVAGAAGTAAEIELEPVEAADTSPSAVDEVDEPALEAEDDYEVVEPSPEAEDVYEVVEPSSEAEDDYEIVEPSPEAEDAYEVVEPSSEAEDDYEVVEPSPEAEDAYEVVEPSSEAEDVYEVVERSPEAEDVYEIVEPTVPTAGDLISRIVDDAMPHRADISGPQAGDFEIEAPMDSEPLAADEPGQGDVSMATGEPDEIAVEIPMAADEPDQIAVEVPMAADEPDQIAVEVPMAADEPDQIAVEVPMAAGDPLAVLDTEGDEVIGDLDGRDEVEAAADEIPDFDLDDVEPTPAGDLPPAVMPPMTGGAPELDFEAQPYAEAAAHVPELDLIADAEESDVAEAVAWDEQEAEAPRPRSSAGPLGERAAAALCDTLVLLAIGAALVGAASSGTGLPFRQVLVEEAVWLFLAWSIFAAGYSIFFVGSCGQTIGRMVMRLRVIREDQFTVGFERAALRLAAWVGALLPLGAGLLPALRDPKRRGLHDRLSHTRVVKA